MKKVLSVIASFIIIILVSACTSEPPTTLRNEQYGYEITFPRGWSLHQRDTKVLKSYAAQSEDYSTEGIYNNRKRWATEVVVWKKTKYNTFERIYKRMLNSFKSFGPIEGKIIETTTYMRDGNEHRKVISETKGMGRQGAHYCTFVDTDKYVLIIHSSCTPRYFESAQKEFGSIIDSLKFF
ncbi:MAG: hypothetical protein JSW40_08160 [Candidatus Omnitrophota bacterium]|nr:MAG: hypothetical protein JSW40_08160 [Candidatus Omnitrophota bacterium]